LLLRVNAARTSGGRRVVDRRFSHGAFGPAKEHADVWQVTAPPWAVGEVECDYKVRFAINT